MKRLKSAYESLQQKWIKNQSEYKKYYDQKQKQVNFQINDQVMVYFPVAIQGLSKKLTAKWRGPFVILEKLSEVNYRIKEVNGDKVFAVHVRRLRNYRPWLDV